MRAAHVSRISFAFNIFGRLCFVIVEFTAYMCNFIRSCMHTCLRVYNDFVKNIFHVKQLPFSKEIESLGRIV